MRSPRLLLLGSGLLALVGMLGLVSGGSAATPAATGWGKAREVPGSGTLNVNGNAAVVSVSCATSGNCVAGGHYTDGSGYSQAFVVEEKNGVWGHAIQVPGLAALNSAQGGVGSAVNSVSCPTPGNCAVGGVYSSSQAFLVDEKNGVWGNAIKVPGLAALNSDDADVWSVSCATPGNCAAGGTYVAGPTLCDNPPDPCGPATFVVDETNGTWGNAISFGFPNGWTAGAPTLVSCPTPGNCSASSTYIESLAFGAILHVLVADENAGSWGTPVELGTPGDPRDVASLNSLSCSTPGNCAGGGADNSGVFVVDETNGVWGAPLTVPGSVKLNAGDGAEVTSISCRSAGNCAAGGFYTDRSLIPQAFVVSETNGSWGEALKVRGLAAFNGGRIGPGNQWSGAGARVTSISCGAPGDCNAGGYTHHRLGNEYAFVVSEKNGVWGKATKVPGLATLDSGHLSQVNSVSCPTARNCVAGGQYLHLRHPGGTYRGQAFVVTRH